MSTNHRIIGLTILTAGLLLMGCETPSGRPDNTATGALAGGAIGAGAGAIIGSASHNAGAGALIGGAIGALTGAIVGNSIDQQQRAMLAREYPQTLQRIDQGQPLGLADVKALARAGVSDDVIISQIRNSRTVYHLSTAEIIDLKDSGVSERVIDFMINTPSLYASAPPPPPTANYDEGVVVDSPPPPPPVVDGPVYVSPGPDYFWIEGSWTWYGGRWIWVPGRWVLPPYRGAIWVSGRWVRRGYGGVWMEGHWR
jgi:outer membrane lipoprotein SlyB